MNERDFTNSIRKAAKHFTDLKIALSLSSYYSFNPSDKFRRISLSSDSEYGDVFLAGLRESQYNFILNNRSFFQFSRAADDDYRLAYYPNPFLSGGNSLIDELMLDDTDASSFEFEELSNLLEKSKFNSRIPVIRYEYCIKQYKKLRHPTSHFHIGFHTENRWPSPIIFTPYMFSLHISKMYHPEEWRSVGDDANNLRYLNKFDELMCKEKVNCISLNHACISQEERQQIFIG